MENATIISRLLAIFTLVLTGILAIGAKIIVAFSAVGKSITTGFAAIVAVILLSSIAANSHAGRLIGMNFACKSKADWEKIHEAGAVSKKAFGNKMHEFVATGQCFFTTPGASCIIVDSSVWTGIFEVYIDDYGPYYIQAAGRKGCTYR